MLLDCAYKGKNLKINGFWRVEEVETNGWNEEVSKNEEPKPFLL